MKYIDLGLPSGTKWAESNEEGYYTFNEAVSKYGDALPTKEQFEELKKLCHWEWVDNGYKVMGPNGNSIVLPAMGYCNIIGDVSGVGSSGNYWSSTPNGSDLAWYLFIFSGNMVMSYYNQCGGESIRLIKSNNKNNDMKDKEINIAEILKDCPKGMKLFSTVHGKCTFEGVADDNGLYPIMIRPDFDPCTYCFTAYGKTLNFAEAECQLFPSKDNRDWGTFKVPKPKYEFKPFDKVLGRNSDDTEWNAGFFSHLHTDGQFVCIDDFYSQCIPYEGNEHLLGTTNSPDEKGGKE